MDLLFCLAFQMCWNTYFIVLLNINQNWPKQWAKNDTFSHFAKHRLIEKKPFCCNPPFDQKCVFFNLVFLKPKTLMLNKKHNLKSEKCKDKKKGFQRKSKTGNQKKRNYFRKKLQFNSLMLFFSWNKSKKERKGKKERKTRNKKKAKIKDKKEERKIEKNKR